MFRCILNVIPLGKHGCHFFRAPAFGAILIESPEDTGLWVLLCKEKSPLALHFLSPAQDHTQRREMKCLLEDGKRGHPGSWCVFYLETKSVRCVSLGIAAGLPRVLTGRPGIHKMMKNNGGQKGSDSNGCLPEGGGSEIYGELQYTRRSPEVRSIEYAK